MLEWISGNREFCWQDVVFIETKRTKTRKAQQNKRQDKGEATELTKKSAMEKKYLRAKRLVNAGEFSKAKTALLSSGTAHISEPSVFFFP